MTTRTKALPILWTLTGCGGFGAEARHVERPSAGQPPYSMATPMEESRNTEEYEDHGVNRWTDSGEDRFSTFAIDVDTGSYTIVRRKIREDQRVPPEAVRVEECLNYFRYEDRGPTDQRPFAVHMEAAPSPYGKGKHLLRVAVKAREVPPQARKIAHLVFLVDVSGSMASADKLGLAQQSLRILVNNLNERDTVALVTYAGNTRVVLEPTGMAQRGKILAAIDDLDAGGSTAMESGLELAYRLAVRNVRRDVVSRVIVLSDGDANVGNTTHDELLGTIRAQVDEGVTLSTVGFGMGNYRDHLMEQLADRGNGNYSYVDTPAEARRIFGEELGGTLEVVAQDAKIQVEFDPAAVARYRLVGYENRDVADEDFRNDEVDAGEIGAGHTVSAMYEIELRSGGPAAIATVRIRAEPPGGGEALEHEYPFRADRMRREFEEASRDFRFASAVMGFAEILRQSEHARGWGMEDVRRVAQAATQEGNEQREEFVALLGKI